MKKIFLFYLFSVFLLAFDVKIKDIGKYEELLMNDEIIFSDINLFNPYKSKFKVNENGKIYIKLYNPFFKDKKICGVFAVTEVVPNYNLKNEDSNYPNEFGGKAKFEKIICFNFEEKPDYYINFDKYKGYMYVFELIPTDSSKIIILPNKKVNKYCFYNKYGDFFRTENNTYCVNGKCYPLNSFLRRLEASFPGNQKLVINLPNIECDMLTYYFSSDYVTKLLIIDPTLNEVKDVIYLENNYEMNDGNDDIDIDEGY